MKSARGATAILAATTTLEAFLFRPFSSSASSIANKRLHSKQQT